MSVELSSRGSPADEARYRANLQGEIDSAAVYRAMARAEENEQLASVYERLAEVEERHLDFWEQRLRSMGADPGPRRPSWPARTMSLLARRFGPRVTLPTVATFEQVDQGDYDEQPETAGTGMRDQERSHARVLRFVAGGSPQGVAGETLARLEGRHKPPGGNALRAVGLGHLIGMALT
jgi:demethoxyubiquinone hydroxylase (CLK1/Coq7/Cat5 family)